MGPLTGTMRLSAALALSAFSSRSLLVHNLSSLIFALSSSSFLPFTQDLAPFSRSASLPCSLPSSLPSFITSSLSFPLAIAASGALSSVRQNSQILFSISASALTLIFVHNFCRVSCAGSVIIITFYHNNRTFR